MTASDAYQNENENMRTFSGVDSDWPWVPLIVGNSQK